jgi:hypothetical protein
MKFRAVIKETQGWWIGWLVDLPGVNAQERTREAGFSDSLSWRFSLLTFGCGIRCRTGYDTLSGCLPCPR